MGDTTNEHHDEIIELLIQHGALSVASIRDMAATSIQVPFTAHQSLISYRPGTRGAWLADRLQP
jgi:hypothetical protein